MSHKKQWTSHISEVSITDADGNVVDKKMIEDVSDIPRGVTFSPGFITSRDQRIRRAIRVENSDAY